MSKRTALVMGGGAGTGRAIVLALAAEGYRVVFTDIDPAGGGKTLAALEKAGRTGRFVEADLASAEDTRRVFEIITTEFGALHAACNSAALGTPNLPFTDVGEDDWDRCMNVSLKGVWRAMQKQLPLIESSGGGAIVNIASVSGLRGEAQQSVYAAAKGGLITLSKSAATEYARRGVRVNTVCPGGIDSGGMAFYLERMPEMQQRVLDSHAMGRLAEPAEIADAVAFLCSERASFITGHDLVVDGGILVRSNVLEL
jgi:NAD(P)-dependent dehydrogenase (short-subunit alcohol dehydrogenase family)